MRGSLNGNFLFVRSRIRQAWGVFKCSQSVSVAWSITVVLLWRDIELSGMPPETEYFPYVSLRFTHRKSDNKARGCCIVIWSFQILFPHWAKDENPHVCQSTFVMTGFQQLKIQPELETWHLLADESFQCRRVSGTSTSPAPPPRDLQLSITIGNGRWTTSFECYGSQFSRLMANKRTIMNQPTNS
jgi:hypothetical protein